MSGTTVLLHNIEGPVNLGSVCRAMANTGFANLRFSGELQGNEGEARKFAVHSREILDSAAHASSLETLTQGLDIVYGFTPRNPWPDGRGLDLDQFLVSWKQSVEEGKQIGLLFGNEARGLKNDELARCHYRVVLPAHADYVSMNLAQAVLVVLWEIRRLGEVGSSEPDPEMATGEEKAALIENIREFLDVLEFLNPQNPEHLWLEILPIFNTRQWTKRELTILHAMFGKSKSRHRAIRKKAGLEQVNNK